MADPPEPNANAGVEAASAVAGLCSPPAATKRRRGSGPRLNDLQRLEIVRKRQAATPPVSLRQLARDYGVDEKTVRRVVAASADIEARAGSSAAMGRRGRAFRKPSPKFPELERALAAWLDARERAKAEISPSVVIDKAKLVARALGIQPTQFKASWGWYDKFCRRYGVRTAFLGSSGRGMQTTETIAAGKTETAPSSASASKEKPRETKSLAELHALMAAYDPEWVFTVDETPLFYDHLPFGAILGSPEPESATIRPPVAVEREAANVTGAQHPAAEQQTSPSSLERPLVTSSGEMSSPNTPRTGADKETLHNRVTLVVCCNSTGRLAPPICMVGKTTWPTQLSNQGPGRSRSAMSRFPLPYLVQVRAWLDRATFSRWFDAVFLPFVRERTSKPALLVVDGARPGHQGDFEQDDVRVVFLPSPPQPQTSAVFRGIPVTVGRSWWAKPLEMGVLGTLKMRYKCLLVQSVLAFRDAPEEVKLALRAAEARGNTKDGGVHFGHTATLLDAARLLVRAWSQVPKDLLQNCFARANLVPPSKLLAMPAPPICQQENTELTRYYDNDSAEEIEKMLTASCVAERIQTASNALGGEIRAFLQLDAEDSAEFQAQLRVEINEALSEELPVAAMATLSSTRQAEMLNAGASVAVAAHQTQDLAMEVRSLLFSAAEVASRLRLLPQTGADAEKLSSRQLESSIAAADQIRQCIQGFDATLHPVNATSSSSEREEGAANAAAGRVEDEGTAIV